MLPGADSLEETAELILRFDDFDGYAEKLKLYRKKHCLTQAELGNLLGVKPFTVRSWEQKKAKPPYHVWRLHKYLFD